MRRRVREVQTVSGAGVPDNLLHFSPEQWPAISDFQSWQAWDTARREWADENLPSGQNDLPAWEGSIPDQPWNEVEHLI